jgi:hypothetical protein
MSGGKFDYNQTYIKQIAEEIEMQIEINGKTIEKGRLWFDADYYERYPEERKHYEYPKEVVDKFKEAVSILEKAYVYAHNIDYLLSGDYGEESFLERLEKELDELEREK